MVGRRAIARLAFSEALSSYANVKQVHVHLLHESELLKPNSFCGRAVLVRRSGVELVEILENFIM